MTILKEHYFRSLAQKSLCPSLCHELDECTWDLESRNLTTKADTAQQQDNERMEKEAWYEDEYGSHMQDMLKNNRKNVLHPRPSTTLMANILSGQFMRGTIQDMLAPLAL